MNRYIKKQLIIAFVYLIIFSVIGGGVYFGFFYSPTTCFDSILNQGEERADCGGPCAVCQDELFPMKIVSSEILPVENGLYDLVALVENPNLNYGSENLPYSFKVYDYSGAIIHEQRGRTYIMPREKKYIIDVVSLSESPKNAIFEFGALDINRWSKFRLVEDLRLPIFGQNIDFSGKNGNAVLASGTAYNQTKFDLAEIDINVIVFDQRNKVIAVNKTQKNTVRSGEGRYFEVVWPEAFSNNPSGTRVEMSAYANVFSNANFISTFLE